MYTLIINPKAGFGRALRVYNKIKKSPLYSTDACESFFTESTGHAESIAHMVSQRKTPPKCIIVVGGDGTLHEVMNGVGKRHLPVGFIPGGSGNDFARGVKVKGNEKKMFEHIIQHGVSIPYWCGTYTSGERQPRQFVNSIGFGFDAEIAGYANRSNHKKWLSFFRLDGLRYVFALIYILFHFKPFNVTLTLDGVKQEIQSCWMVTIANHPFYGGGMKIIPHAKVEPKVFPVLVIHGISKWKILTLFMTVFTGKHLSFKEVDCYMASNVEFRSNREVEFQVDGQTDVCTYSRVTKNTSAVRVAGNFDAHMLENSRHFR